MRLSLKRIRLRFSLRFLFVLVAVAALACHYVSSPSLRAYEFARALEAGADERAERLFVDAERAFPGLWGTPEQIRESSVTIAPLDWDQLLSGQRYVFVYVPRGSEILDFDWHITYVAKRNGLNFQLVWH